MGYVASIITSSLGYNKTDKFGVMSAKNYDENIQKDLFMLKDENAKPMAYNFSMTITLLLVILQKTPFPKNTTFRKTPLKIQKRGMRRAVEYVNNMTFRGRPAYFTYTKREMVTIAGVVRKASIKMAYPPYESLIHPDGRHMFYYNDCSGKSHHVAIDMDTITENGDVKVVGTFTTSGKGFENQKPLEVDNLTFTGKKKNQYFLTLIPTRWAKLADLRFSPELHAALSNNPKYRSVIEKYVKQENANPTYNVADSETVIGFVGT